MKKNLSELELNIPTLNLLESRKITGGYGSDDDCWQGSPGEENNPYDIPEVVVTPGEQPDPGYDPHEREEEQEDAREDQEHNNETHDDGRDNGKGSESNQDPDRVEVPNGWCILGSLASVIQALTGCSADEAIKQADAALKEAGIREEPGVIDPPGIPTPSPDEMEKAVNAADREVVPTDRDNGYSEQAISDHFENGGEGIGFIEGDPGHAVHVEDYDNGHFTCYDPVTGEEGQYNGSDFTGGMILIK